MTLKQKITGLSIIALTLFSLATLPIQAQLKRQNSVDAMSKSQGLNVDKYSLNSLHGDIASFGELILPTGTTDGEKLTYGAVPILATSVAHLAVRPPVKTSEYVADVLNNVGIVQPAYAQGIGFAGLSPILNIWKAFRNLSYFLFIIIFVIVGFMIMFRAQINPQTVVTVQSALPKLVLTLILITFSYAIAGFVVDLIYLSTFIIFSLFETFDIIQQKEAAIDAVFGLSIFRIGISYFIAPGEAAGEASNAVSAVAQGLVGMPNLFLFDWIIDALAYLIIAVAILVQMFRTFFALLISYIGIIMSVIFAPIQLLLNALPGSDSFSNWLRGLVANAAVFPTIAVMVIVGAYLVGGNRVADLGITPQDQFGVNQGSGFIPPMITTRSGDEEFGVEQIRGIIGLGILMLLPEAAKIVKGAIQVKDNGYGETAMGGLQRGWGFVSAPVMFPVNFTKTVVGSVSGGILQGVGQSAYRATGLDQKIGDWAGKLRQGKAETAAGDDHREVEQTAAERAQSLPQPGDPMQRNVDHTNEKLD